MCLSSLPPQVMHEYTALENFWRRYNKVLLDKLAQDREKLLLEDENTQLKALLKQYLDGGYTNYLADGIPYNYA